jgi:hypothetical protein
LTIAPKTGKKPAEIPPGLAAHGDRFLACKLGRKEQESGY